MSSPSRSFVAMQNASPLVKCITNYVAMSLHANVLLAALTLLLHCAVGGTCDRLVARIG